MPFILHLKYYFSYPTIHGWATIPASAKRNVMR
jgi:hypothetical protein